MSRARAKEVVRNDTGLAGELRGRARLTASPCAVTRDMRSRSRSGQAAPGEQQEIRGEDRGAHVRVKARRAFPHAARRAKDPLQERDPALDPGAEAAEFVIDPRAADHVADGEAALLREADVLDARGLCTS